MTMLEPFADLARVRNLIDRAFEETAAAKTQATRAWRPPVDLFEDENAFTLQLELPGVDREKIEVEVTHEELVIRGERPYVKPEAGNIVHSERVYGQFQRSFRLGVPVQNNAVEAQYADGILTVRLPKTESVKPRRIEVRANDGANG
jgi:HSP20 family protein